MCLEPTGLLWIGCLIGLFLDPKIQIRYIDTKHQIPNTLTKGHLTRDEWNNLLHLFNLRLFSSLCCAKNLSLLSCITERMAKRMQEQKEENRIAAKSRLTVTNLTSSVATSSSPVNSPIASRSPGILKASSRQVGLPGRPDASTNQNSNPDAALKDGKEMLNFSSAQGKPVATGQDQKSLNLQQKSVIRTRKLVATEVQGCSGNPEIPGDSEDSEPKGRIWPHHFRISPDCAPHKKKVCSIVRKIYDRKPTDVLNDLDVNTAIWDRFMSVTLQAAVHLVRDYLQNIRSVKNLSSKSVEQLLWTTEKLIQEQTEIIGLSTINWNQSVWRESSLLCDGAVRIMKSKTYVFSDSAPCLEGISPEPAQGWKYKIKWYLETRYLNEVDRIDGEPMENRWNSSGKFRRIHYTGNSH